MEIDVTENWTKDSWRKKPIVQVPDYDDKELVSNVETRLS